jgi:Cu/Ag efflux pump CusA
MLSRIIEWSSGNRFLVLLATLLIIVWGVFAVLRTPIDALPDLSDVQVIVYTEYPGQAPQVVEDQVTYPLTTAMLSVPRSRVVRGFSFFGASFVYIIFDDGTDIYWARARVLEYLNFAAGRMPRGVTPQIGPDATGVGWVYQYVLLARDKTLAELRSIQDWYVRYQLTKAHGVAEVASVGGFVQTYQVTVDPVKLRAYGIPLMKVAQVIRDSNRDVGGRTVEMAETEYMVRGRGYLRGLGDIESLVVRSAAGVPVRVRDIARVELAPDERRGHDRTQWRRRSRFRNRHGALWRERPRSHPEPQGRRSPKSAPACPPGSSIEAVYDRSELIHRAIETLQTHATRGIADRRPRLFRLPAPSAQCAGRHPDAAGRHSDGLHRHAPARHELEPDEPRRHRDRHRGDDRRGDRHDRERAQAPRTAAGWPLVAGPHAGHARRLPGGRPRPVLLAVDHHRFLSAGVQPHRPGGAAVLAARLYQDLRHGERGDPLGDPGAGPDAALHSRQDPAGSKESGESLPHVGLSAAHRRRHALAENDPAGCRTAPRGDERLPASRLGAEFMPTLNEGSLLYMPASLPGMSITKAAELLQTQNKIIKSFPEVSSVHGKAGRANTATDPAPTEMFETVINLHPESVWRPGMTIDQLIAELDQALQFPGVANSWTMPIKARIDMLSTGIRTPIGIKVFGKDLEQMEQLAKRIEAVLKTVPGTTSAFAERITGGFYIDIEPDREQLARYGLSVGDLQDVIGSALGGEMVTTTVEGRERFGVSVRYPRELRASPEQMAREVLLSTMDGAMIPLGQVARVVVTRGAPSIRTENALLSAYIYVDIRDRDIGRYVADAKQAVAEQVSFPPGYYITWSGQFEYMERAIEKMKVVIPVTLLSILLLLYLNFRRLTETLIVMLSVPFALVGGVWLLWLLDYHLSVAVAVGFISLAGVAAETGVIMLIYLDHAWQEVRERCRTAGRQPTRGDLYEAVMTGAVERVRPKMMTVVAIMAGLLPILWSRGSGSEVMSRIAAPMVGGMLSSTLLTLAVIPAIYALVKQWRLPHGREE